MAVNDKMRAIAEPLRTLTGRTDTLTLDEMAGIAADANTHVANALSVLAKKGVDTSGVLLSGLHEAIAGISSGEIKVSTGSFTVASNITLYTGNVHLVEHNSGFVPNAYIVYPREETVENNNELGLFACLIQGSLGTLGMTVTAALARLGTAGRYIWSSTNANFSDKRINEQYFLIMGQAVGGTTATYLMASKTYNWCAIGI